jgi:hypothetical protein
MECRLPRGDKPPIEDFRSIGIPLSGRTDENVENVCQAILEIGSVG